MQSLDDFNDMMRRAYRKHQLEAPALNGIACPKCGKELYDSAPGIRLASNPPQMKVSCLACGYRGYRVA